MPTDTNVTNVKLPNGNFYSGASSGLNTAAAQPPPVISSDVLAPSGSSLNLPPPPPPTVPSVADIISQYSQPTTAETNALNERSSALGNISTIEGQIGQKSAEQTRLEGQFGVTDLNSQANQLQQLIRSNTTISQQEQLAAQSTGGLSSQVDARSAEAGRQLSSKLLGLSAALDAVNGNLALANDKVTRALSAEFDPLQSQLDYQKTLLDNVANTDLSTAQKQKADALAATLADRQNQIDEQKTTRSQIYSIITQNGASIPADVINKALTSDPNTGLALISQYSQPAGRYKDTITTTTDAFGNQNQTVRVFDTLTGQFVDGPAGTTAAQMNAGSGGAGSGTAGAGSNSGLTFSQYGLLSKTDFNPTNSVDELAQRYLDAYIKTGTVPTTSVLGRNLKPGAMATIDSRARDLYFKATGQPLPNPEVIKGYQQQLIGNNNLLNNLKVQEGTIQANADLLLNNLNAGNINQAAPIVNGIIDNVRNALGDPNVAAYLAQNTTVANELGALLALKNAQGTTVHDKLVSAGLITAGANAAQIATVVKQLMQEASNAHDAIKNASADLYKQIDPLMQDPNNPARTQQLNQQFVEQALTGQGPNYYQTLLSQMQAQQGSHAGMQPALDAKTGQPGFATPQEIAAGTAIPL